MSLNKLVGGDCGGNNNLVQLSTIIGRDASLAQSVSQADQFVNDFMDQTSAVPQTFNMNALLNSIPELDTHESNKLISNPSTSYYNENMKSVHQPWLYSAPTFIPSQTFHSSFYPDMTMNQSYQPPVNVQVEYLNESDLETVTMDDTSIKNKAQEYVNAMDNDDKMAYNQFMSFMKSISAGETNLSNPPEQDQTKKLSWDEMFNGMTEKYKEEWAKLSDVSDIWQNENANGIPKEYTFSEGNVMLENKSALEIGKEKLKMGDVPGAVLCFEAAVQQQPETAECWFLLGTTQAENEQDCLAITALKKSLELDPTRRDGYITLAAAYTNENLSRLAILSLYEWLNSSPKYSDLLPRDIDPKTLDYKELETHVKSLYLQSARLDPLNVDPDVQNSLGVLFNITQEYDKAIDCFQTALMIANEDFKLWNRLGATLANSNRSEEAVQAYQEALKLEPGFIRARYNVGITCMNLGAHREAAEHFLVALNQQNKAKSLCPEISTVDTSSSTIWTTLRMVCSLMGEHDVARLVDERKLNELNNFFK